MGRAEIQAWEGRRVRRDTQRNPRGGQRGALAIFRYKRSRKKWV